MNIPLYFFFQGDKTNRLDFLRHFESVSPITLAKEQLIKKTAQNVPKVISSSECLM